MDWDFIMNTAIATLCASLISISGMLLINWLGNRKGYKDIKNKIGEIKNQSLVGHIDEKIGNTLENMSLSQQHANISEMAEKQKEEFAKRQFLTGDQTSIVQSIAVLAGFKQEMIDLQNENVKLKQKNKLLLEENLSLKQKNSELSQQMNQQQEEELEENPEMKM